MPPNQKLTWPENVRRNFDESYALWGARRVAKRPPQIDLDRRPVEDSLVNFEKERQISLP